MNDITVRRPIKWSGQGDTHVGMVRKVNEDSILINPELCLWVVADGMGGYEAGDFASDMIVSSLNEAENIPCLNEMAESVDARLQAINSNILEYSNRELNKRTIGSTVVCLIIRDAVGTCLWAGDSRLYRFSKQQLERVTQDHSQVEELLRQGLISKEEAQNHPDSNVITRAIGANSRVSIDKVSFSILPGDTFLLCSDGLYNAVSEDDFAYYLRTFNAQECVDGLISKALENGASDNISVIVIKGERGKSEINPSFLIDELLSE